MNVQTRIITISANSPLCKFLNDLEFLLKSCQEWEKNVHGGVFLDGVIFRWRWLELSGWKGILAAKVADATRDTGTWWLHVAAVLEEAKIPEWGRKENHPNPTLIHGIFKSGRFPSMSWHFVIFEGLNGLVLSYTMSIVTKETRIPGESFLILFPFEVTLFNFTDSGCSVWFLQHDW